MLVPMPPVGIPADAVRIRHKKLALIFCVSLQIEYASRKHVGDHIRANHFILEAKKRQHLFPDINSLFTVPDLHSCITVIITLNIPFKPKAN
jgi:hypothetical protein